MIDLVDAPVAGTPGSALLLVEAWAAAEHGLGVLPLVEAFFETGALAEVAEGRKRGALGLFTPTPGLGWAAAAVDGEPAGAEVLLQGLVRLPGPAFDGALVLVRLGGELRLAWVEEGARGVERRGARTGGPVRGGSPCWLALDQAAVAPGLLSRPVTLDPGSALVRHLEAYAGVWARAAAECARDGVQALRRAARTASFQGSQLVALGITEVEIEADLTAAAVRRLDGLAVAAAAARILAAVAARTEELRDAFGLEIEGPLADGAAGTLTAFLGGALMLESEAARVLLGIGGEGPG